MTDETTGDATGSVPPWADRRTFLGAVGATGAAALTTGVETVGAQSSEPPVQYPNASHRGVTGADPSAVQWNLINTQNTPQFSHHLLFEKFGQWSYADGEFVSAGIESWGDTGDAFELTIRDGLTWSNGDAVTAEDVAIQLRLEEYDEDGMWDWAESVEAVDDATVRVVKSGDVNPNLVEFDVLQRHLFADRATYGEKLSVLESRGAPPLDDAAEIFAFRDEDPNTNGPFELETRDEQTMVTSWNGDHPDAGNINFGEYVLESVSGNQRRQQALVSLLVDSDYSVATPQYVVDGMPDAVEQVTVPNLFGVGFAPNHDDVHVGRRGVRQAIAHVVSRQSAVQNSLPASKLAPQIPTGIASAVREQWLGDVTESFEYYGVDAVQSGAAASALESAGYAKSDGSWVGPDGNELTLTLSHPPGWSDWILALESAAQDLTDFGIPTTVRPVNDYTAARENTDFQLLAHTWLHNNPSTYPYYSLRHQLVDHASFPTVDNYPPAVESRGGSEADVTVPAMSGDGETTVNPSSRIEELGTTSDAATEQEIVTELAWVANQDLPHIPLAEKLLQQWLTSDDWAIPENPQEDPDANVQWAPSWLPRKGKMNRKPVTPSVSYAVDVRTPENSIERGEVATVEVVLESAPEGLSSFDLSVRARNTDEAIVVDASLGEAFGGEATRESAAEATLAGTDEGDAVSAGAEDVVLGTVTLLGTGVAETRVDVLPGDGGLEADADNPVITETSPGAIVVASSSLTPLHGVIPGDLDGDGLHQDLNANGRLDSDDVVTYFDEFGSDALRNHPDAYSYNDNDRIDFDDVVELFESL